MHPITIRRSCVLAAAVLAMGSLAGCASLLHRDRTPSSEDLAERYGCARSDVESNWSRHRYAPVAPGTPLCATIGRYGDPVTFSDQHSADMRLVSTLHHQGDRYFNVTYVYYDDTPVNRKLGRKVGVWMVQRYSESR